MESDLLAAVETLRSSVRELAVAVDGLSARSDVQQGIIDQLRAQRKTGVINRVIAVAALVGLAIGLGSTAWQGVTSARVSDNARAVQAVQERTSSQVLCPLYQVFVDAAKYNPIPPNLPAEQVQFRADAAATIAAGMQTLGCKANK